MKSRWRKRAIRIGGGLALAAALAAVLDPAAIVRVLAGVDLATWGVAIATAIAANAASAWRWSRVAERIAVRIPWSSAWRVYAEAVTVSNVLPGATLGGDAWRALQLRRRGAPLTDAALTVAIDRAAGVWVVAALGGLAWALLGAATRIDPWIGRLYALALAGVLLGVPVGGWLAARLAGHPVFSRLRGIGGPRLADALQALYGRRQVLGRAWAGALAPSVPVQALSMGAFGLCLHAAGVRVDATAVVFAAGFVFIGVAAPVSVGGWGVREAAAVGALAGMGVPAENAAVGAALYGLAATVQAVIALPLFLADRQPGEIPDAAAPSVDHDLR